MNAFDRNLLNLTVTTLLSTLAAAKTAPQSVETCDGGAREKPEVPGTSPGKADLDPMRGRSFTGDGHETL